MRKAKRDPIPRITTPMLPTLIDEAFNDSDWLWETKWDGYRALCKIDQNGKLSLTSRNGLDFLGRFPEMEDLAEAFVSTPILLDGEIVSLDDKGRSSFQRLQQSFNREDGQGALKYAVFDLIYGDGTDLQKEPLETRKSLLLDLIHDKELVLYSKHIIGKGVAQYERARKQRLEGVVGKKRSSVYKQGRTRDWVKVKVRLQQECVIGGYTDPRGSRKGLGSLLLGLYSFERKTSGELHFVGRVGTGFDTQTLISIHDKLKKIETKHSPFAQEVKLGTPIHWVRPKYVAEVSFEEWTADYRMRQPVFLGLRIDKDPKSSVFEFPIKTARLRAS